MFWFGKDLIFIIPAVLIAITIHEYAHGLTAEFFGDPTPRVQGRLSLNPLVHINPLGLIVMFLLKFGWAKSIEFNPRYFRNTTKAVFFVSLAGPIANIIIGIISALVLGLLFKIEIKNEFILKIIQYTYHYNTIFAIFNLLPIPPLDGSKVLFSFFPLSLKSSSLVRYFEQYGFFIIIFLISLGLVGLIIQPIESFFNAMVQLLIVFIFNL